MSRDRSAATAPPPQDDAPGEQPRTMLVVGDVLKIVPFSRSTLYRLERARRFPRSHPLGHKIRFWYADEITAWQRSLGTK
jgi:prophage regulatory protein